MPSSLDVLLDFFYSGKTGDKPDLIQTNGGVVVVLKQKQLMLMFQLQPQPLVN